MLFWLALVLILCISLYLVLRQVQRKPTHTPAQSISLPENLEDYLQNSESRFNDIIEGAQKEIIWAGKPNQKTSLSIIYLHGFSATKQEIRPVPDMIAKTLGANLFYTRLTGHGRGSAAMAQASIQDWIDDVAEAVAIGNRIGGRTLILSTSTGSTLAAELALSDNPLKEKVAGLVCVSPNFALKAAGSVLLTAPLANWFVPLLLGKTYTPNDTPSPEEQKWWTIKYPITALFPMARLVKDVSRLNPGKATLPALFIYSRADKIVDASKTDEIFQNWGAPKQRLLITTTEDANHHLIAGDALSPKNNELLADTIVEWVQNQLKEKEAKPPLSHQTE